MKQALIRLASRLDARSSRERVIVFALVLTMVLVVFDTFVLKPQRQRQAQLQQRADEDRAAITAMRAELQRKTRLQGVDPDRDNKARLEQLRAELDQLKVVLNDKRKGIVRPENMPALLRDVVRGDQALKLVSLRTLPAVPLTEPSNAKAVPGGAAAQNADSASSANSADNSGKGLNAPDAVYRHRVEIVVQGGYADLLSYLTQLEALPWQFIWDGAKLETGEYPLSTLTLTLSTLSLEKKWLNL